MTGQRLSIEVMNPIAERFHSLEYDGSILFCDGNLVHNTGDRVSDNALLTGTMQQPDRDISIETFRGKGKKVSVSTLISRMDVINRSLLRGVGYEPLSAGFVEGKRRAESVRLTTNVVSEKRLSSLENYISGNPKYEINPKMDPVQEWTERVFTNAHPGLQDLVRNLVHRHDRAILRLLTESGSGLTMKQIKGLLENQYGYDAVSLELIARGLSLIKKFLEDPHTNRTGYASRVLTNVVQAEDPIDTRIYFWKR